MAVGALVVVLLPVVMVLGVVFAMRRPAAAADDPAVASAVLATHRHTLRWRLGGLAAAVGVPLLLVTGVLPLPVDSAPGLGRGLAVAPALGSVLFLLGVVVGELTAPRARTRQRTATLETRRVTDVLPARMAAVVGTGVLLLTALLTATSAAGAPDDLGRPGRALAATCPVDGSGALASSSVGPWPGTFYAVPIAAGIVATALITLTGLVVVARRPRPGAAAATLDTLLRRQAARNLLLAVGVVAFGTLAPVSALVAAALGRNDCGPAWWQGAAWGALAMALATALLAAWSLAGLFVSATARVVAEPVRQQAAGA